MVYHPAAAPVEVAAQITEARDSAAAAGETLFVVVGHISFNRALLPSGFAVIENPEWFTEVARFDGIESEHHYRVYRAR